MLAKFIIFLDALKVKNYEFVREHFGGDGLENTSKEELRDYYYALGKADVCEELMQEIERLFGNVHREDILRAAGKENQ